MEKSGEQGQTMVRKYPSPMMSKWKG
jgi:hypothetical protein